jgi:glycosyltransferase involved in cell wall biosynthesis
MAFGISVIIACFNSEKVIATTLKHLQDQKNHAHVNWEVILVDNNCTDNTAQLAKKIWAENPIVELKVISEKKIGEANARKAGIAITQYDILSIVDDDNWVSENWIEKLSEYYKNPDIGLIGCAGEGEYEEKPPHWFAQYQHSFAIGKLYEGNFVEITSDAYVPGAGLSMRKNVFEKLETLGWQPILQGRVGNKQSAGADTEMCLATRLLGYKIYYSNELKFKHFTAKHRISWQRLLNMTEGFGESDVFILPYNILYKEETGKGGLINSLRKFWWFNYIGKKIALLISDPLPFIRNSEFEDRIIVRTRNNAFCKSIFENRKKFKACLLNLETVTKNKNKI